MPIASRRTLPPLPPPVHASPLAEYAFLGALAVGFVLLLRWHPILAFLLSLLVAYFWLDLRRAKRHAAELAAKRQGGTICTFVRAFDYRCTDTRIIRAVYEQFQPLCDFPLHPGDNLYEDLRLDPESFELDWAPDIARRAGRSLEDAESNPYLGRVFTVGELVVFLCAQPPVTPRPA